MKFSKVIRPLSSHKPLWRRGQTGKASSSSKEIVRNQEMRLSEGS